MMNKDETYQSKDLYEYYKKWLNTALTAYRSSDEGSAKDTWLRVAHRASCLTDLHLRLINHYKRSHHE